MASLEHNEVGVVWEAIEVALGVDVVVVDLEEGVAHSGGRGGDRGGREADTEY